VLLVAADATVGHVASTGAAAGGFVSGDVRTLHGYRATCIVWKEPAESDEAAARRPALRARLRTGPQVLGRRLRVRSVMRRLVVRDGVAELFEPAAQRAEVLLKRRDGLLLVEDDLAQLCVLLLEVRVADLEVDEARFHGRRGYQSAASYRSPLVIACV
jgi:hypothetical protein